MWTSSGLKQLQNVSERIAGLFHGRRNLLSSEEVVLPKRLLCLVLVCPNAL